MKRSVVTGLMIGAMALGALGAWAGWYAVKDDDFEVMEPQAGDEGVPLVDTYWKLVELAGKPVGGVNLPEREPYITLQSNEGKPRLVGFSGCNRMSGGYSVDKDTVQFTDVVMTRMACVKNTDIEDAFTQALDHAAKWDVDGTMLRIYDAQGATLAKFEQRLL